MLHFATECISEHRTCQWSDIDDLSDVRKMVLDETKFLSEMRQTEEDEGFVKQAQYILFCDSQPPSESVSFKSWHQCHSWIQTFHIFSMGKSCKCTKGILYFKKGKGICVFCLESFQNLRTVPILLTGSNSEYCWLPQIMNHFKFEIYDSDLWTSFFLSLSFG